MSTTSLSAHAVSAKNTITASVKATASIVGALNRRASLTGAVSRAFAVVGSVSVGKPQEVEFATNAEVLEMLTKVLHG